MTTKKTNKSIVKNKRLVNKKESSKTVINFRKGDCSRPRDTPRITDNKKTKTKTFSCKRVGPGPEDNSHRDEQ